MIDVIGAEIYRACRQGSIFFWGYLTVPLIYFLFSVGLGALAPTTDAAMLAAGGESLAGLLATAADAMASVLAMTCFIPAAVALMANDYRYETWRLLVPRRSRPALILAKIAAFVLLAGFSLCVGLLLAVAAAFLAALVPDAAPLAIDLTARTLPPLVLHLGISVLEIGIVGLGAGVVAIATRSTLAGTLAGLMAVVGQLLILAYFSPPLDAAAALVFPAQAADMLHAWSSGRIDNGGAAGLAAGMLGFWLVALVVGAVTVFQRQDLAGE